FWRWLFAVGVRSTVARCWAEEREVWATCREPVWCGWRDALVFAVFPVVLLATGFALMQARGPVWFFYRDPEYAYLFSSVHMLRGIAPLHTDHPGTLLQLLGALIMAVTDLGNWGQKTPVTELLRHGERTLAAINGILLVLMALIAWASGMFGRWACRSFSAGLLLQAAWFATPVSIAYLHRSTPELPLLMLAQLMGAVAVAMAERASLRRSLVLAVVLAVLCGLLIAMKVIALPLVVLLGAIAGSRRRMAALALVPATFLVCTIPIWQHFAKTLSWLATVGQHTGYYGEGKVGVFDVAFSAGLFSEIVVREWPFFAAVAIGLGALVGGLAKGLGKQCDGRALLTIIALTSVASLGISLLTFKHPYARYLIPAVPLSGVALVLSLGVWQRLGGQGTRIDLASRFGVAALFLLFAFGAVSFRASEMTRKEEFRTALAEREAFLKQQPNARVAAHINGPIEAGAFLFGRYFTDPGLKDPAYNDAFGALFPGLLWAQHPKLVVADAWGAPFQAWAEPSGPVTVNVVAFDSPSWDAVGLARLDGYEAKVVLLQPWGQVLALRPLEKTPAPMPPLPEAPKAD
ncbi:MAG: hypothetical protein ACOYMN_19695, partial [Roseimicrobium sp.]